VADFAKSSWPKFADGTTDWGAVFEDPETGLIPLIVQAKSKEFLRQCAGVVIRDLFTRDNDQPEVERLTTHLDSVLATAGEDIETAKASVSSLLREIKQDRIAQAKAYLAEKAAKETGGDRRRKRKRKKTLADNARDPVVMAICAAIILCGAGLGVIGAMLYGDWEEAARSPDEAAEISALKNKSGSDSETKIESDATEEPEPEAEFPKSVSLQPLVWSITNSKGKKKRLYYAPVVEIRSLSQQSSICKSMPWLRDVLISALSQLHPQTTPAERADLEFMSENIAKTVRPRFGKLKFVITLGSGRSWIPVIVCE